MILMMGIVAIVFVIFQSRIESSSSLCEVFKHLFVLNDAIFALDCFPSVLVNFNIIGNRPEIFLGLNRALWRPLIPVIFREQVFAAELQPDSDKSGFAIENSQL